MFDVEKWNHFRKMRIYKNEAEYNLSIHDSMSREWRDLNNEYPDAQSLYDSGLTCEQVREILVNKEKHKQEFFLFLMSVA